MIEGGLRPGSWTVISASVDVRRRSPAEEDSRGIICGDAGNSYEGR